MPFETTRRVEFGDTDMAGIVHFANFFRYMEAAETEFLRSRGLSVSWETGGRRCGLPRVAASCDYTKPARFGDLLTIAVTVEKVGTKSITYRHEISRDGVSLAVGRITCVYIEKSPDGGMQSAEIPADFRARLEG